MSFRRASLTGSAELFQPTRVPDQPATARPAPAPEPPPPPPARPSGRLYRLGDDEIRIVLQAIQQAKFPTTTSSRSKPALDEFDQLEAVRQSLLRQRNERA